MKFFFFIKVKLINIFHFPFSLFNLNQHNRISKMTKIIFENFYFYFLFLEIFLLNINV